MLLDALVGIREFLQPHELDVLFMRGTGTLCGDGLNRISTRADCWADKGPKTNAKQAARRWVRVMMVYAVIKVVGLLPRFWKMTKITCIRYAE